jgi:hypothetical protein
VVLEPRQEDKDNLPHIPTKEWGCLEVSWWLGATYKAGQGVILGAGLGGMLQGKFGAQTFSLW